MADPDPRLVFVDLETTGLDPRRHGIVEIAMVITTPDLEEIYAFTDVVMWHGEWSLEARAMHEASGLLDEEAATMAEAEPVILRRLDQHGFAPGTALLAGSSVHFDRGFINAHMPAFAARLHYRHFDVSMIREAIRRWVDPDFDRDRPEPKHRAYPDVLASIDLGKRCREVIAAGRVPR